MENLLNSNTSTIGILLVYGGCYFYFLSSTTITAKTGLYLTLDPLFAASDNLGKETVGINYKI